MVLRWIPVVNKHHSRIVAYALSTCLIPSPLKSITPSFRFVSLPAYAVAEVLLLMVKPESTANVLPLTRAVAKLMSVSPEILLIPVTHVLVSGLADLWGTKFGGTGA